MYPDNRCHLPPDRSGAVYAQRCTQVQDASLDSLPTPEPVYSVPPIEVTATQTNYWLLGVVLLALVALSRRGRRGR